MKSINARTRVIGHDCPTMRPFIDTPFFIANPLQANALARLRHAVTFPGGVAVLSGGPGGLAAEAIEACLGVRLALPASTPQQPTAPGQLDSHYAPAASLRLNAVNPVAGECWLGFGARSDGAALNLSPGGDLIEAAANLFHFLHEADRIAGVNGTIAVAPIPDHGLGRAINDRLRRAAAPR